MFEVVKPVNSNELLKNDNELDLIIIIFITNS